MGSVHKQQKKNLTEEVDKLGNLPSCIIGHILSFLPTKYAVRTSILSTTWKNNWKSITNLDFDIFLSSACNRPSFVNFVYRVLLHLKSSRLNKFRLSCNLDLNDSEASHINSWVSAALLHEVQEINICRIGFKEDCFLPSDLFKCQTLVVLELSKGFLKVPNSVCLPKLKVLRLVQIEFNDGESSSYDGESSSRLISNSPVLEDLTLDSCVFRIVSFLKISSLGLKKLLVISNGITGFPNYGFVLDAPQIEFLDLSGYSPEEDTRGNFDFLVEAIMRKAVFDYFKTKSTVFHKLKTLNYWVCDVDGCSLMKDMVECSPHLESLSLDFSYAMPLEKITHNICKLLKKVELNRFEGNATELEFVKHILKNANALKKFEIYWARFSTGIEEEVFAFPRASTSCELVFSHY